MEITAKFRHSITSLAITALLLASCMTTALAQATVSAVATLPSSSIPGPAGRVAHTSLRILASSGSFTAAPELNGPPFAGFLYQTPASLACIYGLEPAASSAGSILTWLP